MPARSPAAPPGRLFVLSIATLLYFSQGFPFGVVQELFGLYLRSENVPLSAIGFINGVGIAWTLKFLWAPAVDLFGTYRRWIAAAILAIMGALLAIAAGGAANWPLFVAAAAVLAFGSATQDIAIDANTIRMTPRELLGPVNSIRIVAYRVAMIAAGAGLTFIAAKTSWSTAFTAGAVVMGLVLAATTLVPSVERSPGSHANPFAGLVAWLRRPRAFAILALVLLYKMGDSAITPMTKPFWIDHGYSAVEVAQVTTVFGVSMIAAGAIAGGAFTARFGLYRSLIVLGVAQIASNVVYAVVAQTTTSRPMLYTSALVEAFTYGLATAAFLAFLMSVCDRDHAATEYAMLSAVFGLSRTIVATFSGVATESFGYAGYFWLTVFLGVPGLLLVAFLRRTIDGEGAGTSVGAVLQS